MGESNEQSYNKIAESWIAGREKSATPVEVVKFVESLEAGSRVLDVGCGGGAPIARYLADRGLEVSGFDISEELVSRAETIVPEASFQKADINSFETDKQFDGVVAWDSLFHLKLGEHAEALSKVMSWVKDSGYLLFTHGGEAGEISGEMHGAPFT